MYTMKPCHQMLVTFVVTYTIPKFLLAHKKRSDPQPNTKDQ